METNGVLDFELAGDEPLVIHLAECIRQRSHRVLGLHTTDAAVRAWAERNSVPILGGAAETPPDYLITLADPSGLNPGETLPARKGVVALFHGQIGPRQVTRTAEHGKGPAISRIGVYRLTAPDRTTSAVGQFAVDPVEGDTACSLDARWYEAAVAEFRKLVEVWEQRQEREATGVTGGGEVTERQLRTAVDTMQIGVTVTDLGGRIVFTNPADAAMHGYTVDELLGQDVRTFAPTPPAQRLSSEEIRGLSSWRRESENVRKDGSTFAVSLTSDVVTDRDGEPVGIVTSCQDISARKRAESALRTSEERYALAAAAANDGLWDWDLVSDEVIYAARWTAMLGLDDDLPHTPETWFDRIHDDDAPGVMAAVQAHIDGHTAHFEREFRLQHADGSWRWMRCRGLAVRDHAGQAIRIAGSQTDITDQKRAEEQLALGALYHPETGLPNRGLFESLVSQALARQRRNARSQFAVILVDLDGFKLVNDSLGHAVGDRLLAIIADRLEACRREGDVLAHFGGDDFAILAHDVTDAGAAADIAARICRVVAEPVTLDDQTVYPSATAGIVLSGSEYGDAGELLRDADTAIYRAKARDDARHEVFVPAMREAVVARHRLGNELRRAHERGEFRVHYQPIVSLGTGRIRGFEALVRWNHPTRGLLAPSEFLELAAETGLIVPMGWWVLDTACRQTREWHRRFPGGQPLTISVNLSAKQFAQPDIVDRITTTLDNAGLDAQALHLELTESTLVEGDDTATAIFDELRSHNVRIHMDDFGTGYSSFSQLQRIPVDGLKIDRSFVQDLARRAKDLEILRHIVRLAQDLDVPAVAEGVTNPEQLAVVRNLGCAFGQGFLFSPPVTADRATELLAADHGEIAPSETARPSSSSGHGVLRKVG